MAKPLPASTEQRILSKIKVDKKTGCWIWQGSCYPSGYGQLWNGERPEAAHRVSYRLFKGEIPSNREIDHKCDRRPCVNPKHIRLATHRFNIRRSSSIMGLNARKTHCKRGHPFRGRNLFITVSKTRQCRTCINMHGRNAKQRKREHNGQ